MWFRILMLAVGTFALGTDVQVIAGVLPTIAHDVAVPVATTGLLVSVFALTYALGAPTLATLTGSMARRRLLIGSLAVFVGANVLAAASTNFGVLVLARILAAVGAALYTPTASAVGAAIAPAEQPGVPACAQERLASVFKSNLLRGFRLCTRPLRGNGTVRPVPLPLRGPV